MPHLQGVSRDAVLLFPPTLDEYITADNPARFVDAFVDSLDLQALGFQRELAATEGRPAYQPGDLLKLYLYGYLNGVRSSRRLERETQRNVEVMWLLKKLTPDHKTIADFRKDNLAAMQQVCREFTRLCKELELFGGELVAIDGSKFLAVNSRQRNYTPEKLRRALKEIDKKVTRYLAELDEQDAQEQTVTLVAADELRTKIARLRVRQEHYQSVQAQLEQGGQPQLSLTDPDSRSMPAGQGTVVGYNVQTAVDAKHKLIAAHEVTNAVTDQDQLAPMAQQAKQALGVETLDATTDKGYYDGEQVQQCLAQGVTPYIPKPHTSVNQQRGLYTKEDFTYDRQRDLYRCPAGALLDFRFESVERGRATSYYATPACRTCAVRARCTQNKGGRRITRWAGEHLLDDMAERVKAHPEIVAQRKALSEHPFGTIKRAMGQGYFLMKGLLKVRAEMSLTVLAYNLKRVLNILGVPKLIAAVA
jgi:transposase